MKLVVFWYDKLIFIEKIEGSEMEVFGNGESIYIDYELNLSIFCELSLEEFLGKLVRVFFFMFEFWRELYLKVFEEMDKELCIYFVIDFFYSGLIIVIVFK